MVGKNKHGGDLVKSVPKFQGRGWIVGWHNITKYLGRGIPTARAYHTKFGMPLHRLPGDVPVAIPAELDLWLIEFSNRHKGSEGLRKLKEFRTACLSKGRDVQDGVSREPLQDLDSEELKEFKEMFE